MKKYIFSIILSFLFLGRQVAAENNTPSLLLQINWKDYKSLIHNEKNLKINAGYDLVENNFLTKPKDVPLFEKENTSQIFINNNLFPTKRKLFLGLNYEYHHNGSQEMSFLSKSRDTNNNYLTLGVTPREISAVFRINF